MNVFTYGSLMFPEVWLRVTGQACPATPATLAGFAAWKVRGESYPGLAPAPGKHTSGLLYSDVSASAAARLDAFEGPFYIRTALEVALPGGARVTAHTYLVAPEHRHELEPVEWDKNEFQRLHLDRFLGPKPLA